MHLIKRDDFPPKFDHDFNVVSSSFQCPSRVYSAQTQRIEPSYQPSLFEPSGVRKRKYLDCLAFQPIVLTLPLMAKMLCRTNFFLELLCEECQKVLETPDDIKWHFETTYGKEDCKILKSML